MRAPYPSSRTRTRTLVGVGALVTAIAVTGGFLHERGRADASDGGVVVGTAPKEATPGSPAFIAQDFDSHVALSVLTYDPGQSSGWHRHAGVHAIAVLSGVLTIVDAACTLSTYTPDEPYLGGQEAHLAINETDVAVRLVVTHVAPRHVDAGDRTVVVPPPPGCRLE